MCLTSSVIEMLIGIVWLMPSSGVLFNSKICYPVQLFSFEMSKGGTGNRPQDSLKLKDISQSISMV